MLKVTICIGSSCHLKGSRQVVEGLQRLIAAHSLQDRVDLPEALVQSAPAVRGGRLRFQPLAQRWIARYPAQ